MRHQSDHDGIGVPGVYLGPSGGGRITPSRQAAPEATV